MDLCLNSVRLETLNINEIFFLNYSKHQGLQLWWEDRLQIAGGRWQMKGDGWHVTGDRWQVTGDRWQVTGDMWQVTNEIIFSFCFLIPPLSCFSSCQWCYYPHQSGDSVSPPCRIFLPHIWSKLPQLLHDL